MGRDFLVKRRLGEERFVALVVAMAPVAIHIDDDVALEVLAELEREPGAPGDRERVVSINVKNRRLDHFGDVGGIKRGAGVGGQRGEADLVIDDDVDRAAGAVAGKLGHVEYLRDDALAGERGIAMEEQREDLAAVVGVLEDALAGPGHPFDDGIDRLEMARIRSEPDGDLVPEEVLRVVV